MPKIVIADTSCLIVLDKLQLLYILKNLYSEIVTTPEIASEFSATLPSWIEIVPTQNIAKVELSKLVDLGEASAIALALEIENSLLILDDLQARKIATSLALSFTGTLGVLVKAKRLNLLIEIKPILKRLREVGFRVSSKVEEDILKQCNEL